MVSLTVNGTRHDVDVDPDMPLAWAIRDKIGLTGTKVSCGAGICGACTVHVDGQPVRSCSVPVSAAAGKAITTIEGLSPDGRHPLQVAWLELDAPQCGYCQSGMLLAVYALLVRNAKPTDADIDAAISNLCACGTYPRVRNAIKTADLVIGGVLIPGAKAPKLITRDMLPTMKKGAVIVDVAIDQGGCFETSKPTTHAEPCYEVDGVVHYCVANMPGAVPYTSTLALTNATLPYAVQLANKGWKKACADSNELKLGLNVINGKVVYKGVAEAFNLEYTEVDSFLN